MYSTLYGLPNDNLIYLSALTNYYCNILTTAFDEICDSYLISIS